MISGNVEDIPVVENVCPPSDEAVELKLRDYQEEVLTPALKGQNAMVVLPTGTGKTEVAIALISRRFLARNPVGATNHRRQKSVFVVNKVPLVKQQKDRCLKYLRGKCKVAGVSGVESNRVPLNSVIDSNDITVLTAQVLVDALKDDNIKLKLSDIALLVIDECHHCQKSNPYNVLMAMYRDLKLNSPELPRPQILGLTASPGVGNSKNTVQAERYITKLCANLDCRISRPKIYADQLNARSSSPQEIPIITKGRPIEDPFFHEISVIMGRIEDKIVEGGRALVEENDEFAKMVSRRGTQIYEQGVVKLEEKIQQTIENGNGIWELMTCVNYLRDLHAISYMEDYINEKEERNPSGSADMILRNMFRDKLETLNRNANLPASINPVLNELDKQLKKEYAENEDSSSIIFTKTRALAKALVKWLNKDPDLNHTKAEIFIGSGNQGMTSTEQNRILQLFRDKKCRILVATSVAEEGLDITNCNMVFSYNYVTSDIGYVQTKGRIRADCNGKMFVIVNSDLQLQDLELKTIIRVEMMNEAVQSIADFTLDDQEAFDDQIRKEQENDQKKRQRENDLARDIKANKVEKSGIVLHCKNCSEEACSLDDIRCIEDQHHVVTNDLFLDKIDLCNPTKKRLSDDKFRPLKDIHCGNCPYKWGTMMKYQKQDFPLIAVKNFRLMDDKGNKFLYKKWTDVPFAIRSIDMDDLGKQDPEGVQEKGEFEEDDVYIDYQTPYSDPVSDGKLNTLAAHVPHEKYNDLSCKLGIGYNQASTILHNPGSTYQKATRECLSIWKNKTGGSFTELKKIFNDVELGGVWMEHMN
ncbi:probable ATP-dependent RNA helicase DHX58 [Strongylocentrotus purpuratus]|uniref:RNA helicase n=1 Tax=Strongylocentrotus purpuratus TaxID=7668 RepID=A0A7M7HDR3_STRPU|nr:probable ATP-dependent RNA helicase DHX58 [Strongylocentrotus purpuratus]|eukprot:XP_011665774.1 PREDICTED: probable ATP-dependent RNA helicase DHX58 [Strongylocentrotus purpuratus]